MMTRNKHCPGCGYHFSFRRFWTLTTQYFECPVCGTRMTVPFGRIFGVTLLTSNFCAVPMALGLTHGHGWWALLPLWAALHLALHYYFLDIRFYKGPVFKSGPLPGRPVPGDQSP